MKHAYPLLIVLVLSLLAGCAANPTDRWHQAQDSLTTARTVVLQQHALGNVDDADLVAADQFEKVARMSLDVAAKYLPDGGGRFEFYVEAAQRLLNQMIEHYGGAK